ncbi:MAG: hypothetical protein QXR09_02025 [Candidatus Aenigmatarchaeota archaeon]
MKKLERYLELLKKDYISSWKCEGEEKTRINHVRIIIELLDGKPEKLWEENFPDEVEKYERQIFREYMNTRTPHHKGQLLEQ